MAPDVRLPTALDHRRYTDRVRTVVTVSTPHYGTPVASFFTGLLGQKLLQVLSLSTIYILRFGHFLAVSRIPIMAADFAMSLPYPPALIMVIIAFIYLLGFLAHEKGNASEARRLFDEAFASLGPQAAPAPGEGDLKKADEFFNKIPNDLPPSPATSYFRGLEYAAMVSIGRSSGASD